MNLPLQKPQKTFADYVVIAISPVLIMCLVGSLAFFLVRVFCRTDAIASIRWVLFWFVLAIVLVSRIAIEKSITHAVVYGGGLALATCLFLAWMTPVMIIPATVVLAITWWCAHKLTFDCTLIDDAEDASGRGVLEDALPGPDRGKPSPPVITPKAPPLIKVPASPPKTRPAPGRWVVYFSLAALPLFGIGQLLLPNDEPGPRRAGFVLLLIYLAAALSLLVTTSFLGLRRYLRQRYLKMPQNIAVGWMRFGVVVILVMLALAILLPRPGADYTWKTLTYQINHQVHRASDYAFGWNTPGEGDGWPGTDFGNGSTEKREPKNNSQSRPSESQPSSSTQPNATGPHSESGPGNNNGGPATPTSAPNQPDSAPQQTGPNRPGSSGRSTGSGQQSGERDQNGKGPPRISSRTGGAGGDDGADENRRYADQPDPSGVDRGGGGGGGQRKVERSTPSQARRTPVEAQHPTEPEPTPVPKPRTVNLELLFKILLIVLVTAVVAWFAIRNRALIAQLFREFIAMLKRFFSGLAGFRWKRKQAVSRQPGVSKTELPAFAEFNDPFLTGKDSVWPRERLIIYTYEALQAWSRDHQYAPRSEETPREFCLRLRRQFPEVTFELNHLLLLYTYAAFAEMLPDDPDLEPLQRLWGFLSTAGQAVSSTPEPVGSLS